MQIRRILFFAAFLFLGITTSFAYTVILKNGKRVEGAFIEEDDSKIFLKDKDGIILTFRKTTLELPAMAKLNQGEDKKIAETDHKDNKSSNSQKRVFTNEDLKDLPEISEFSPNNSPEFYEKYSDDPTLEAEQYWKEETRKLAVEINEAKDNYEQLKHDCEQAEQTLAFYVLNGYGSLGIGQDVAILCDQANQAKAELDRWEKRLEQFQEHARKKGALPGWVDPDRIDQ